ncbi:pesticin C-terminus-like muramidase [Shewanella oncorhynchi]|uniref:pesticin C-terminus-like muramidase n=1 Tax=Shewanella oncorhynchi TaxID=2726434 RepID=UPI003D796465
MTKVNFGFISGLEGGPVLRGYVPDPKQSNSGVTIATGFDLGQRSFDELHRLLPAPLATKLGPYCGLKKQDAVNVLAQIPLKITAAEAEEIDLSVKHQMLTQLVQRYNRAAKADFEDLSEPMQTVIASVAFQYGDLSKRCPKFWRAATQADSDAMALELRDFGDRYQSRRHREANYLQMLRTKVTA